MERIVVIGAGGHCKVALDIAKDSGQYEVIGLLDFCQKTELLGVPIIGTDERLEELFAKGIRTGFVAIGNNYVRRRLMEKMENIGFEFASLISRYAVISQYAKLEKGCIVMPGAVVNACARVEKGCILNTNSSVDHDCQIGSFVHIAPGCAISGSTCIGDNSFLGTGSQVIDGIKVGRDVMVGAGAVVIRDIPDCCTAVGNPARIIKKKGI